MWPRFEKKEADRDRKISFNRGVLWGWALSFIATIHLIFLPSILPHVLGGIRSGGGKRTESGGVHHDGLYGDGHHRKLRHQPSDPQGEADRGDRRGCAWRPRSFKLLLFLSRGVISFAAIRMLQTGVVAAVIPMVMANFGSKLGGTGIGFLNSARFAGNGVGPLLATFVLAGSNLLTLYLIIAVLDGRFRTGVFGITA